MNLRTRDLTNEELALAAIFARHVAVAFESDQVLQKIAQSAKPIASTDFSTMRRLGLTRRECEVLCWLAEGKRDGEIAIILGLSTRTVQMHVRAILGKLNVETRTAAVASALCAGTCLAMPQADGHSSASRR